MTGDESDKPFKISGAIRLHSNAVETVGIVTYSFTARPSNMLFIATENRLKQIRAFDPIESDDCAQFVTTPLRKIILTGDEVRSIGDPSVLCYFFGEDAYFFDYTVAHDVSPSSMRFLQLLEGSSSFSAYSVRSYLLNSYAKNFDAVKRLGKQLSAAWIDAEMGFFQRSKIYWKELERSNQSDGERGIGISISELDRSELLEWIKQNPTGYLDNEELWLKVWTLLFDFGRQPEVITQLGVDYLEDTGIRGAGSVTVFLRISRRVGRQDSDRLASIFSNDLVDGDFDFIDCSYADIDRILRLCQLVSFSVFHTEAQKAYEPQQLASILQKWRALVSKGKSKACIQPHTEWLGGCLGLLRNLSASWPSKVPSLLSIIDYSLTHSQRFTQERGELRFMISTILNELSEIEQERKKKNNNDN